MLSEDITPEDKILNTGSIIGHTDSNGVSLQQIPYPYKSMLSICSDLDETADRKDYFEIIRYLNTNKMTRIGKGLSLEVGNSIYFDMPADQFSYWNTDDKGRSISQDLIRSGHIDCLHSFGDLATTRSHAARALDELERNDCHIKVWIDHSTAPSNFGKDIMCGYGDIFGSETYHSDITCDYGIQYVWRGRVTSVIGQNVPRSMKGIWKKASPINSTVTLSKEFLKIFLSSFGYTKYHMHNGNKIFEKTRLRDGQTIYEFIRSNPHCGGVSSCETADGIGEVINKDMLSLLKNRGGVCILYTHLGKFEPRPEIFPNKTVKALELLSTYFREKFILVTTTKRLLTYCRALKNINWTSSITDKHLIIDIRTDLPIEDLMGVSFKISNNSKLLIRVNGLESEAFKQQVPNQTGEMILSSPWYPLELPQI